MEAIGINLGYLIVHTLNFLMMLVILSALAYRPILNALDDRRQRIARGLEDARVAAEARENAEADAERIITEAQTKAGQIIREATERAETAAREVRNEVEEQVERERAQALEEAQEEKERVLRDLRGQVVSLSMAAAQKLIGESLDERKQRQIIDQFLTGIRDGRVQGLAGMAATRAASAEITSALPLTDSEKEIIRSEVLSKIGDQATITFRVKPSILGGLVVRVGDKVWDSSIAGQLGDLGESIG